MQSFSSLSQIEGKSYKVLFFFLGAKIPPFVSGGDTVTQILLYKKIALIFGRCPFCHM